MFSAAAQPGCTHHLYHLINISRKQTNQPTTIVKGTTHFPKLFHIIFSTSSTHPPSHNRAIAYQPRPSMSFFFLRAVLFSWNQRLGGTRRCIIHGRLAVKLEQPNQACGVILLLCDWLNMRSVWRLIFPIIDFTCTKLPRYQVTAGGNRQD